MLFTVIIIFTAGSVMSTIVTDVIFYIRSDSELAPKNAIRY